MPLSVFSLLISTLFAVLVLPVQGQVVGDSLPMAGALGSAAASLAEPGSSEVGLNEKQVMALGDQTFNLLRLEKDFLAVVGILVVSVVLAMRRRVHLVFGNRRH